MTLVVDNMHLLVKILVDQKDVAEKPCYLQMEWLIFYKTHLYTLFIIIGHKSDALKSGTDAGGDASFYNPVSSLNNLGETDMCHKLQRLP